MRAVPVCIWTSWAGLAKGQRWTIFGYGREIMGLYRSRHECTNKSRRAISLYTDSSVGPWGKCRRMSRTSEWFTQTHVQWAPMCYNPRSPAHRGCWYNKFKSQHWVTGLWQVFQDLQITVSYHEDIQWGCLREFTVSNISAEQCKITTKKKQCSYCFIK